MNGIGSVEGIGAPLPPNRIGGDDFIRYIGDRLILDFHEGGGTTVRDLSGWGNDLTLTGNENWRLGSFYLDGSSYFSIADAAQQGLDMELSDFMVEASIQTSSSGSVEIICSKVDAWPHLEGWAFFKPVMDQLSIVISDSITGEKYATSTATINDGRRHYVVAVIDRSNPTGLKLFVDGSEVSYSLQEDATAIGSLDNAIVFEIGGLDGTNDLWTGSLDEVRVWNFGYGGLHIGSIGILQQYLYHKWKNQ